MTSHSWFLLGIIITAGPLMWLWVVALNDLQRAREQHEEAGLEWGREKVRLHARYDELAADLEVCQNAISGDQPMEDPSRDRLARSLDELVAELKLDPGVTGAGRRRVYLLALIFTAAGALLCETRSQDLRS